MSAAHWHLMLNHIPLLGLFFGAILLAYGVWRTSDAVKTASLGLLALAGLSTIAVYLTGEPAEEVVEGLAGVSHDAIEAHEAIAVYALIAGITTGIVALGALLYGWIRRSLARRAVLLALVLSLATTGLLGYVANQGGKISHPELRGSTASAVETEMDGEGLNSGPGTDAEPAEER